ncbi:MAG: hypothetical protein PHY29_02520 [Syntrophales bacterium]|nr:hypothetical protein [Syntrophales bacterium]
MTEHRKRYHKDWILVTLLVSQIFLVGIFLTDIKVVCVTFLVAAIFASPGFFFFVCQGSRALVAAIYGIPLGVAYSSLVVTVCVALKGWNLTLLSCSYIVSIFFIVYISKRIRQQAEILLEANTFSLEESYPIWGLFAVISLYVALVTIPLLNVGKLTEYGYAYTGLFGHDFVIRGLYAVAASQNVPIDNFYFAGHHLKNFYLLWYILPAAIYKAMSGLCNIKDVLIIMSLGSVPVFFLLLCAVSPHFMKEEKSEVTDKGKRRKRFLTIIVVPFFAASFHWIYALVKLFVQEVYPFPLLMEYTKELGFLSQTWFRCFLFEPHVMLVIMIAMVIIVISENGPSYMRSITIGVLLSAMALTDSITFLIFGLSYFIYQIVCSAAAKEKFVVRDLVVTLAVGLCCLLVMMYLDILGFAKYSNKILFELNLKILVALPFLLFLTLGVIPVTAYLGIKLSKHTMKTIFALLMTGIAVLFLTCITDALEGNVVLRKSLYFVRMPLFFLSIQYVYSMNKGIFNKVIIFLMILALPTVVTDVWATSGIYKGAGTIYITPGEMEASSWIKTNTTRDSIVQSMIEYEYPGKFGYSVTIFFGERKAALGLWKGAKMFYPNYDAIRDRASAINTIFSTEEPKKRQELLAELNIDYVFIGEKERARYKDCEKYFTADKTNYEKVFDNAEVSIFRIKRG